MTNYRKSYNKSIAKSREGFRDSLRKFKNLQAGVSKADNMAKLKGRKKTTFLVGESYRDYEDPQQNTHCQRTWVYGKESSMKVAEDNLENTLTRLDGKGTNDQVMSSFRKTAFPKFRTGDGPNSLPMESENFFSFKKFFFLRIFENFIFALFLYFRW